MTEPTLRHAPRAFLRVAILAFVLAAAQGLGAAWAQTIHAVLVADTNDPSIGASVAKDLGGLTRMLQAASGATGMKLELQALEGAQVTLQNVRAAVQRVNAGPNDAVIFYYSGHGYRTWNKQSRFPYLYISQQGQDFGEIVAELRKRSPRLLIAVTDSCNEYADLPVAAAMRSMSQMDMKRNYSRLWLEAQGEIVIASSSEGEYAWGDDTVGGYFTSRFLKSHEAAVTSPQPGWESILTTAKAVFTVPAGSTTYKQTPIVEAKISYRAPVTASAPQPAPQPAPKPMPAAVAPSKVAWVPAANGAIPPAALIGGQEQGRSIAICRASYNNGLHPGKVAGKACSIGWGGREIPVLQYEVLTGDPKTVSWVRAANGAAPANAYVGGQEPSRRLVVCRAAYQNGVYPGKLVARNCNFGLNGREILAPQYEVMVAPQ